LLAWLDSRDRGYHVTDVDDPMRALADQRALERLTEHYAHAADRREPASVASLFTADGVLAIFMDGAGSEPTEQHRGRPAIAAAIAALNRYDATTHFLGQRGFEVTGQQALGETYCLAYHVRRKPGLLVNVVLSIRYLDRCVRRDGRWLFTERRLVTDWMDRSEHSRR
jgi:SnoaL-like domain